MADTPGDAHAREAVMSLSLSAAEPIRVMLCDDSAVSRSALTRIIEADPALKIVARAADGQQAVSEVSRRIGNQPVDILVLDLEMPVMDGLTAIPLLVRADPRLRILVASNLTTSGAKSALQALRLGAADYIAKPTARSTEAGGNFEQEILEKLRGQARLRRAGGLASPMAGNLEGERHLQTRPVGRERPVLLAIGSSTGGPQALSILLSGLGPRLRSPTVLTQHMPANFVPLLAEHLTRVSGVPCRPAADGELLIPGTVLLAPGNRHMLIEPSPAGLRTRLSDGPQVNFCRPAVDPMLGSAAAATGGRLLSVILTGMGHDGLAGTTRVIEAGGTALAQDEATSVVWGMPGAVAQAGLCHAVLPICDLAGRIIDLMRV